LPATFARTVRVASVLPPAARTALVGLIEPMRLADDNVIVNDMLPPKPPMLLSEIVEVALAPVPIERVGMFEEMEKSGTLTVSVRLCERVPILPVTVTMYTPGVVFAGAETVSVDGDDPLADRLTVAGFREMPSPEGETLPVNDMLPESPLRLAIVIVEFADAPAGNETVLGIATMPKSST
jgi:hypothetical protein